MSQLRLSSADRRPILYERIRFNTTLEALALRRIADHDPEGCRAAFVMLLDRLDFTAAAGRAREVVILLIDLLQQVNSRLNSEADAGAYQLYRLAIVEQFSAYHDPVQARAAFLPALDRLIAPLGSQTVSPHPIVARAQAYVEENYPRRLSLSIVARELRVSSNHLSRLFRRETGSTLTSHIHRVRLEHALLLLASGGRSLSEIAFLVGYQNYRDFYRNFIKHEKASPRQVRHRLAFEA